MLTYTLENNKIVVKDTEEVKSETITLDEFLNEEFENLTGVPLIINTSFNLRGEPIVCAPEDAISCFKRSEMDYLVLGNFVISRMGN